MFDNCRFCVLELAATNKSDININGKFALLEWKYEENYCHITCIFHGDGIL